MDDIPKNHLPTAGAIPIIGFVERSVLRIIDANFNRAREAIRLVEEYCRFALNSTTLSSRAKQLRHRLCATIQMLDTDALIACRDSQGDVGRGLQVADQLCRKNIKDCFTAAAKRLGEALRVLAEMCQTINPAATAKLEQLRFDAYTLEKDVTLFADSALRFRGVRLYVLLTPATGPAGAAGAASEELMALAQSCIAGGADCLQLRAVGLPDDVVFEMAVRLRGICAEAGIIFIVNDRVDIALASGADGVHLGQSDLPIARVRQLQTGPMIVGASTHNIEQLHRAIADGADYVALGPVFATPTKPEARVAGLEYVSRAVRTLADTGLCHVAIGGINLENLHTVLKAGARAIAVCSAVTNAGNAGNTCAQLRARIVAQM